MDKKLKIALAQLNPLVGDVSGNIDKLISIRSGLGEDVDILEHQSFMYLVIQLMI